MPAPRSLGRRLLRALVSTVVLTALLAGMPWLLYATTTAVWAQGTEAIAHLFTRQDTGAAFMLALCAIGWIAWAGFTLSVLLEIPAQLRGRRAPALPGLHLSQRAAGTLVSGILVAFASSTLASATPALAAPITATSAAEIVHPGSAATAAERAAETAGTERAASRTYTVRDARPAESLWSIAEKLYGHGELYTKIADANEGQRMADGTIFSVDAPLQPGWILALPHAPTDTTPPAAEAGPAVHTVKEESSTHQRAVEAAHADAAAGQTVVSGPDPGLQHTADPAARNDSGSRPAPGASGGEQSAEVTVREGDSLWSIADAHGDPEGWPAIYEANKGEPMPGGGTFDNPDVILPGQVLELPGTKAPSAPAPDRSTAKPKTPAPPEDTQHSEKPPSPSTPDADQDTPPTATPSPFPTAQSPSSPVPIPGTSTPPAVDHSANNSAMSTLLSAAGGTLVAGGVVLMLRRRRTLQRRRRENGRTITMPTGRAAVTEQALRSMDSTSELLLLDTALRTLASRLAAEDRALPPVAAVQLGAEGVLLHLSKTTDRYDGKSPLEAVAPFTAVKDRPELWWCPAGSTELLDNDELSEVAAPYPGLVPLGEDTAGGVLLIDLEEFGALHLTGSRRLQMLRTLGISLALSPLGQVDVLVAGEDTAPGLSLLDAQRVQPHQGLESAAAAAGAHHAGQQQLMADVDLPDLFHARVSDNAEEFQPLAVLCDLDTCPAPEAVSRLDDILDAEPLSSTAVITSGAQPARAAASEVWEIDTDAPVLAVPNTSLHCVLSMCSDDEYADILTLAVTADSPTGVPAAEPVPLAKLLPGLETATATVPSPEPGSGRCGAAPSLLSVLADLDEDPADAGEEEGDQEEEGSEAGGEAVAGVSVTARPSSSAAVATGASADVVPVVPVLPASAAPGHVVLPTSRALPQISVRLPSPVPSSPPAQPPATTPAPDGSPGAEQPDVGFPQDRPVVSILGAVEVTGARGTVDSNRRTRAMELAAFLVLHPGATAPQIDEVLSPRGGLTNPKTRNTRLRDVRRWLGLDDEGQPFFRRMTKHAEGHRLVGVECDWIQFQLLHDVALQVPRDQGQGLLRRALELVRGRPFSGVSSTYYSWAEPIVEDINDKVVNSASLLADWYLEAGDGPGALWAASRGLEVAREREELWRHRFRALALLGDHPGLEEAIQRLETLLVDHGWAMEEETSQTIRMVQATRR
ncbi:LysM peptidoglycan-binding domain-containing protein [Streptomyces sp. NBC_01077]|uniref:LysM peptidoglycan-binding domain-containing protein n=1 Tax=Streptomyces sp. NBC_01077 TaxID=2903746 RepID=UPI00386F7448|nr:LysM peptidoglycan-binding domain-containing protein [Streptomyces sp. NBC_01077]WSV43497.1 LysM peptidoglycan-binding domain-containing protein [Streptomyces sp. NBC_01077]